MRLTRCFSFFKNKKRQKQPPYQLIELDEVDSTNLYLRNLHPTEEQRITVVVANHQTAGRGCGTNTWESESGKNLLLSILVHPSMVPVAKQFLLSMAGALAIKEVLDEYTENITLKWPNDVLYKGKKFCGILSEAVIKENIFKGLVIGVGINIEQENIVSEKPFTTLADMGLKVSKSGLGEDIISNFEKVQKQDFISEFKKLCPTINKEIVVDGKKGIFEDIDSAGRMVLKTQKGREVIIAGDVQF